MEDWKMKTAQKKTGPQIRSFTTVESVASAEQEMLNSVSTLGPKGFSEITAGAYEGIAGVFVKGNRAPWFVPSSNIKEIIFQSEDKEG
jgi:hypothetical protein